MGSLRIEGRRKLQPVAIQNDVQGRLVVEAKAPRFLLDGLQNACLQVVGRIAEGIDQQNAGVEVAAAVVRDRVRHFAALWCEESDVGIEGRGDGVPLHLDPDKVEDLRPVDIDVHVEIEDAVITVRQKAREEDAIIGRARDILADREVFAEQVRVERHQFCAQAECAGLGHVPSRI